MEDCSSMKKIKKILFLLGILIISFLIYFSYLYFDINYSYVKKMNIDIPFGSSKLYRNVADRSIWFGEKLIYNVLDVSEKKIDDIAQWKYDKNPEFERAFSLNLDRVKEFTGKSIPKSYKPDLSKPYRYYEGTSPDAPSGKAYLINILGENKIYLIEDNCKYDNI